MKNSLGLFLRIVEGVVVAVIGGLILAAIVQEGRFAPKPTLTVQPAIGIDPVTPDPRLSLSGVQNLTPDQPPTEAYDVQIPKPFTSTLEQIIETGTIGNSVQGRSIDFIRIGNGPRIIVIAGELHGIEPNAANLVDDLRTYFEANQAIIANEFTLYFLPRLNPDGLQSGSRYNANGVDLNRNWDTSNWQPDTVDNKGPAKDRGGSAPFSEPETTAFANFLLTLNQQSVRPMIVINYHARHPPNGLVQPSYRIEGQNQISDPNAYAIAKEFSSQLGYDFSPIWDEYPITGEAIHWCGEHGIICMDVELPSLENLTAFEVQSHFQAIVRP